MLNYGMSAEVREKTANQEHQNHDGASGKEWNSITAVVKFNGYVAKLVCSSRDRQCDQHHTVMAYAASPTEQETPPIYLNEYLPTRLSSTAPVKTQQVPSLLINRLCAGATACQTELNIFC